MALRCSVCDHPKIVDINKGLADGSLSLRDAKGQYGLSKSAMGRHLADHLPMVLQRAAERQAVRQTAVKDDQFMDGILSAITAGRRGVDLGLAAADAVDDPATLYRLTPAFMAQQLRALELLGNATGRLKQEGTTVTVNYLAVAMPRPEDSAPTAIEATCTPMQPDDPDTIDR